MTQPVLLVVPRQVRFNLPLSMVSLHGSFMSQAISLSTC